MGTKRVAMTTAALASSYARLAAHAAQPGRSLLWIHLTVHVVRTSTGWHCVPSWHQTVQWESAAPSAKVTSITIAWHSATESTGTLGLFRNLWHRSLIP